MKPTENYEQLLERFTKRIKQVGSQTSANTVEAEKIKEHLIYVASYMSSSKVIVCIGRLKSNPNEEQPEEKMNAIHTLQNTLVKLKRALQADDIFSTFGDN